MHKTLAIFFILTFLGVQSGYIQGQPCVGYVLDAETNLPLPGVNVSLMHTETGTATDSLGYFALDLPVSPNALIELSYLGYRRMRIEGCPQSNLGRIALQPDPVLLGGAVVSASRFEEALFTSAVTVQRLGNSALSRPVSGDYYQELNSLPGVSVVENSMAFRVLNTRGFNTTSPFRMVQWVDGIDNITPVLNFSPGGFFGPVSLDLDEMEVLSGPASALYGPNAMQGMIVATTRSPFGDEGLALDLQGGTRDFAQAQLRWARLFGASQSFGVKIALSYTRAEEWVGSDSIRNNYRPRSTSPQNLDMLAEQLPGSGKLTPDQEILLSNYANYTQLHPTIRPGIVTYGIPGYRESDLIPDPLARSMKLNTGLYYRSKQGWNLEYLMRYALSTGIYQGNNRAYLKNFSLFQHKIGFTYKGLSAKAYANTDQVGDSYDLVLSGISIAQQQVPTASTGYLLAYAEALQALSNGFTEVPEESDRMEALAEGAQAAASSFVVPGSAAFDQLLTSTITSTNRPVGSRYISRSSIYHGEVQYTLPLNFAQIMAGGSIRRYQPRTEGRLFADTLMQNGEFRNIGFFEYGGFVQASQTWGDWSLQASIRLDKSQNYDLQYSPRIALGFSPAKGHHLRLSGQSAFRTPSLNDQYFLLNVGAFIVRGNAEGYENLYTTASVNAFLSSGGTDTSTLVALQLPRVRPESLRMLELGYRVNLVRSWQMEFVGYAGFYEDFIGSVRAVEPGEGIAGTFSGVEDILNGNYISYNIAANSNSRISTYGATVSVGGLILPGWFAQAGYTYADFQLVKEDDGLVPGFNTPPHRVVLSSSYHFPRGNWSLHARWSWQETFLWESPFADGQVPVNHGLDARIGYRLPGLHSTLGLGANNLYDNAQIQAAGGPEIGSFYYVTWRFDWATPNRDAND